MSGGIRYIDGSVLNFDKKALITDNNSVKYNKNIIDFPTYISIFDINS
jgi:hypothetical protein